MNNTRRKELRRISDAISDLAADLEAVIGDEQEAFDNLPESLQGSERGETMEEFIDTMSDAQSQLEDAAGALMDIAQG